MTDTYFPLRSVNALRRRLARGLTPARRRSLPEGWSRSTVDVDRAVSRVPTLRLREGFTLRAYQFCSMGNGNGIVWAVPADAGWPDPGDCEPVPDHFLGPPRPPGALDDFMEAFEGDGSPRSYLHASLLVRELLELGAIWHGCSWSAHDLVGEEPSGLGLSWLAERPDDWRPVVRSSRRSVRVELITYSGLGRDALYRIVDHYRPGSYVSHTRQQALAVGPNGYVF